MVDAGLFLSLDELADSLVRAERALRIELGAPGGGVLHDADLLDRGAVERKELLNAHAIAVTGDREVAGRVLTAVVDCEHLALEILKTGLLAFPHADGDANDVASFELGEVLLRELRRLFGVDLVQNLDTHFKPSFLRLGRSLFLLGGSLRLDRVMRLEGGVLRTANQGCGRFGRLGTLAEPIVDALDIELEVVVLESGIVPAENLEELAVARGALVGRHDAVGRVVLASGAAQSDFNHFFVSCSSFW